MRRVEKGSRNEGKGGEEAKGDEEQEEEGRERTKSRRAGGSTGA